MKLRNTKSKFGGLLVACSMAFSLMTGAGTVRAADSVTIGVLDEARLGAGYTKFRNAMDDLSSRAKIMQDQLLARKYLDPAEGKRFDVLAGIDRTKPRAAGEETELQALVKSGIDRAREYSEISGKQPRTTKETADFLKWQGYQVKNEEAVNKMEDDAFQTLKTQQDATDKIYIETANAMVQKVAVDRKLTVLLRKDAIVWFTPTVDITDEVLRRLNQ